MANHETDFTRTDDVDRHEDVCWQKHASGCYPQFARHVASGDRCVHP